MARQTIKVQLSPSQIIKVKFENFSIGQGNMLKSEYDSDNDGIVNKASELDDGQGNTVTVEHIQESTHTHDNLAILNAIEEAFTTALKAAYDYAESISHTHSNKSLLDTYSQTEIDLADAVDKKHEHTNQSILDATEEAFTTALKNQYDSFTSPTELAEGALSVDESNRTISEVVPLTSVSNGSSLDTGLDVNSFGLFLLYDGAVDSVIIFLLANGTFSFIKSGYDPLRYNWGSSVAGKINLYLDSGTIVVQNLTGTSTDMKIGFFGV